MAKMRRSDMVNIMQEFIEIKLNEGYHAVDAMDELLERLEETGMRYCDNHWRKELGWEPEDDK